MALLEDGERDIRVGTSTNSIDKDQTTFEARIGQRIHQESTGLSRRRSCSVPMPIMTIKTDGSLTAANGPLAPSGETAISLGRGLEVQYVWGLAERLEGSYLPETDMKKER